MWFHKKAISSNQFKSVLPFSRKPIKQFNLAFLIHSVTHCGGWDIQLVSCRAVPVKTLGGVIAASKAIDQRSREGRKERAIGSQSGI